MARTLTYNLTERLSHFVGGVRVFTKHVAVQWPEEQPEEGSTASNTVHANQYTLFENHPLASIIGKYDNDPSWDDFPAFLEQYRREIDEMNRE